MNKTKLYFFFLLLIAALGIVCFQIPLGANIWNLATGNGYKIPESSSVFQFSPTQMNQGSGEWWIYGEDNQYFYYQDGSIFKKDQTLNCKGFDPINIETWCNDGRK